MLYAETIANPTTSWPTWHAWPELAHRHGAVVVVDNTFASPYLCRPLELGADLVVESATKWLSGHSDVIAGVVAGRARAHRRRPAREHRHRRHRRALQRLPRAARASQTLHVRMDRHTQSAATLARRLEAHPDVRRVAYPGLPSHPQAEVAQRQLRAGGGMLARGPRLAGRAPRPSSTGCASRP